MLVSPYGCTLMSEAAHAAFPRAPGPDFPPAPW
jgi:hypothetical protein